MTARWSRDSTMRRLCRNLAVVALGSTLLALVGVWPFPAAAQRARPPYRIGVLNDARAANHPAVQGLKAGLAEAGLQESRDVIFDVKLTDGSPERMLAAARALVTSGVDVIFTSGDGATLAAKTAAQTIPVVGSRGRVRARPGCGWFESQSRCRSVRRPREPWRRPRRTLGRRRKRLPTRGAAMGPVS